MLVQEIMTREVVSALPDTPIREAHALMEGQRIRHLPVVAAGGGALLGIVSDRDLRAVGGALGRKGVLTPDDPLRAVMNAPVLTAHPLDPIEEAAAVLRGHRIGALPVLEGEVLVGIVSSVDILGALVKMTGVHEASSRLEVEIQNRPGALLEVARAVSEQGVNIASVLTQPGGGDTTRLVLRVGTIDGRGLAQGLRARGLRVTWPPEKP